VIQAKNAFDIGHILRVFNAGVALVALCRAFYNRYRSRAATRAVKALH
jgi:hypothetical protein